MSDLILTASGQSGSILKEMAEKIRRLDKIGSCLFCNRPGSQTMLDRDHYYPQFLLTTPPGLERAQHPLRRVVLNKSNIFRVCRKDHERVDNDKIAAFRAGSDPEQWDPLSLVRLLRDYRISENPRFRQQQLLNMITTNRRFIKAVDSLNGELPKPLVARYHQASDEASLIVQGLAEKLVEVEIKYWDFDDTSSIA